MPFFRDEATCLKFAAVVLLTYYFVMDCVMLKTFMGTDLVQSSRGGDPNELFSPFKHLSVKALICDHTTQYIIGPSAEYFDAFTHFSTVFYFISPNMISFFHLFLAMVCFRLVSSEDLQTRRMGVLLFEFRSWLDSLDGVVYRSHSNTKGVFQSARSTMGYYVDIFSDLLGGVFLMFGVLYYLFKRFDPAKQSQLPWKSSEAGAIANSGMGGAATAYTKKQLLWKCLCWGVAVAFAGKFWDNMIDDFKHIYETPLADPHMAALQFESCHSITNIVFMWVWRLVEGQAMLQYILLAIYLDKIWEFLNLVQYLAASVIISLYIISILYARHMRALLQM
ncbi:ceramide phosphoethanolamine synthase-like [Babylonia areolata]|uniref:ceramide phosphoethanolamine synthase-like n=1 Tax=Babylonia areolata TaxID=304850 RepID=UPI003FCFDDD0